MLKLYHSGLNPVSAMIACAALCALTACGDSKLNDAKGQMAAGCRSGGVAEEVCVCVFDKLVQHYGRDVIVNMNEGGPPPPDFMYYMAVSTKACQ